MLNCNIVVTYEAHKCISKSHFLPRQHISFYDNPFAHMFCNSTNMWVVVKAGREFKCEKIGGGCGGCSGFGGVVVRGLGIRGFQNWTCVEPNWSNWGGLTWSKVQTRHYILPGPIVFEPRHFLVMKQQITRLTQF